MLSCRWFLSHHPTKSSTSSLYSSSLSSVMQQTRESSENFWSSRVEAEVRSLEVEPKWWQDSCLWSSSVAHQHIWQAALQPDILRPFSEVVCDPCHKVLVHLHHRELLSQLGAEGCRMHLRSRRTLSSWCSVAFAGACMLCESGRWWHRWHCQGPEVL